MNSPEPRQSLFEDNNARSQSLTEVVETFVPPESYWRLLSSKNHVLLGSRGSGKTAVLKMLSHDHLSQFRNAAARRAIDQQRFVGLYVPMRAEWVGTLKNKTWHSPEEQEAWFQWRLNISTCAAFIDTMQSCLSAYISSDSMRIVAERELSLSVSRSWSSKRYQAESFSALRSYLEDIEFERQVYSVSYPHPKAGDPRPPGLEFDIELFGPLRRAIVLLKRHIQFPSHTVWALCLDELEFLSASHHRILNTHMRSASGNLAFKMATMPYFHHTLSTNTRAHLVHGDDFEYVNLDFDPAFRGTDRTSWSEWGEQLLEKRLKHKGINIKTFAFSDVFGTRTPLLDEKDQDWTIESQMMKIMRRYATPETINRAMSLAGTSTFRDQISRKIHSALLLRHAASTTKGNAEHDLYGGPKMVIRCSDANPRQLIRLFQWLSFQSPKPEGLHDRVPIYRPSLREQSRLVIDYSNEVLELVSNEEDIGDRLSHFIRQLGSYFQSRFYGYPVTTDHFFAITVDTSVDDETWGLVKYAVGVGLLFPKSRPGSRRVNILPGKGGTFNLSYRLAPAFGLIPRRGRAVSLSQLLKTPIRTRRGSEGGAFQYSLQAIESDSE